MNINSSPIDFSVYEKENLNEYTLDVLWVFVNKVFRARDYIRTHKLALRAANPVLAEEAERIFFDHWVSHYIIYIENLPIFPSEANIPRDLSERLVNAIYDALPSKHRDPFHLVPNSY